MEPLSDLLHSRQSEETPKDLPLKTPRHTFRVSKASTRLPTRFSGRAESRKPNQIYISVSSLHIVIPLLLGAYPALLSFLPHHDSFTHHPQVHTNGSPHRKDGPAVISFYF